MALQLKSPPAPAASPYTKGAPHSTPSCRPYDLGTIVKKAVKRPLGKSAKDAGKAVAEEIIAGLTALHTISEGGSKAFLDVKRQLNDVGMHIHKTGMDNEVRVVPHADKKNADLGYFTDDLEDALHTGLHIAKSTKPVTESLSDDDKWNLHQGGDVNFGPHVSIHKHMHKYDDGSYDDGDGPGYIVKVSGNHPNAGHWEHHTNLKSAVREAKGLSKQKPTSESTDEDANGHHVETYGGGRYTSVAWYKKKADADAEAKRRHTSGSWSGMPPRVVPGRKIN